MSKTERYDQGNDRIDPYTDADFFAAGYDPPLLEILPRSYLAGRLDARSGRCGRDEHWVNRGEGYCRANPGTKRRSLRSPQRNMSQRSANAKLAAGAGATLGVGAIAGAVAMSAIRGSDKAKDEAVDVRKEADRLRKELDETGGELKRKASDLEKAEARTKDLESDLGKSDGELKKVRDRLSEKDAKLEAVGASVREKEGEVARLQEEGEALRREAGDAKRNYEEFRKKAEADVAKYETAIAEQTSRVDELSRSLSEKEAQVDRSSKLFAEERQKLENSNRARRREKSENRKEEMKQYRQLKDLAGYEHTAGQPLPQAEELITMAKGKLNEAQSEVGKTRKALEKATGKLEELQRAVAAVPIVKPGGYLEDPRTKQRPVSPDDRNRDRNLYRMGDIDLTDPNVQRRISESVKNAQVWNEEVMNRPPKPEKGGVGGFIERNSEAFVARGLGAAAGGAAAAMGADPMTAMAIGQGAGAFGRLMKNRDLLARAKKAIAETGRDEDVKVLEALEKSGIKSRKDLNKKEKMKRLRANITRDATIATENRGVDDIINAFFDTYNF